MLTLVSTPLAAPLTPADRSAHCSARVRTVAILGDSISAGFTSQNASYPMQLRALLDPMTPPLMIACMYGDVEAARLLLEKGAAVDAQREDGITALMDACGRGQVEAARLLLEKGADRTLRGKGHPVVDFVQFAPTAESKAQLRALLA